MDKRLIIDKIIIELDRELQNLMTSALDARDAATNEESKAENKYDTRGLEASYLAGAQALRAQEVKEAIDVLQKIKIPNYDDQSPIQVMALVDICIDDVDKFLFFVVPSRGGMKLDVNGESILTISPEAPIGRGLYNKKTGDSFELKLKGEVKNYEIIRVR